MKKYSEELWQKAIKMREQGITRKDIADSLGINFQTLRRVFSARGIRLPNSEPKPKPIRVPKPVVRKPKPTKPKPVKQPKKEKIKVKEPPKLAKRNFGEQKSVKINSKTTIYVSVNDPRSTQKIIDDWNERHSVVEISKFNKQM